MITTLVIFIFSIVQSIFGVGLLVFGTPTLLLLGFPFQDVLLTLLPCSMSISFLQVLSSIEKIDLKRDILLFCVPAVIIGGVSGLILSHTLNIKIIVGVLMIVTAAIRVFPVAQVRIEKLSRKFTKSMLVAIGFIHGLSNMGGGLLTIFIGTIRKRKETIRANIAFAYLVMATSQLIVVLLSSHSVFGWEEVRYILIASVTYSVIGKRFFKLITEDIYQWILTAFIALFGAALLTL